MITAILRAPCENGGGGFPFDAVFRRGVAALFSWLLIAHASAAELGVTPAVVSTQVGAAQLVAGAGSGFASPTLSDVPLATLIISNTNNANWELQIELDIGGLALPSGVSLWLKRGGGNAEQGIVGGLDYRQVSGGPVAFFSGSGDYASVELLLQVDGVTVDVPQDAYMPRLRYSLVVVP